MNREKQKDSGLFQIFQGQKSEKTRQSIQWTPGYTFEWKVVNKKLYKSNKNSLIPTYFLI